MSPLTATKQVCDVLGGESFPKLESPSLRLEKFLRLDKGNKPGKEESAKQRTIEAVIACYEKSSKPRRRPLWDLPNARVLCMRLAARLIVNQAGGILENAGLCLHRHYGVPYIPGSAVKGTARHAAWCEWKDATDSAARRDLARRIAVTFGFPTGDSTGDEALDAYLRETFPDEFGKDAPRNTLAGAVAFLPAFPDGVPSLTLDIVNCHHRNYYSGNEDCLRTSGGRALDDEKPNPQFFPAVEAGAVFHFVLCPLRSSGITGRDPLEDAIGWLNAALQGDGLGAKTSAGYGWFKNDDAADRKVAEERQRRAEEARLNEQLANMSPDDRTAYDLWQSFPATDREGTFKGRLGAIESESEEDRRALLTLCAKQGKTVWLTEQKEYERLKDKPKKQAKSKPFRRVERVLAVAEKLGVTLP